MKSILVHSLLFAILALCTIPSLAQDDATQQQQPTEDPCVMVCEERHRAIKIELDQVLEQKQSILVDKDQLWQQSQNAENEKNAALQEIEGLVQSRDDIIREKDELVQRHENLIREKEELFQEKERLLQELQTLGESGKEIESLKETLEKTESEMAHYRTVAQDNQKYMQEYKSQLASQRDRASKLNLALKEATTKIEELENTTFMAKLQQEVTVAWNAIVEYWTSLRSKGENEGKKEF